MPKTKVALLGSGFIAAIHLESYERFVPDAEVVTVFSRSPRRAEATARAHGIPRWSSDLERAITESDCDVVDICLPNFLHERATVAAAEAGKHVILEKPLAMTLDEADRMIAACRAAGRKLMYAEELCFAPKYERVRKLVGEGAVGKLFQLRQCEKHSGPHSDWFYDVNQSGGGALMDMGCHAFGWFRWMLGKSVRPLSVYATMATHLHAGRTRGEDNSLAIVEFDGGVIGVAENSWAKPGGMDDRIDIIGSAGACYVDLLRGSSLLTYSDVGYGYAVEKAPNTKGWTFTIFEEYWNYGIPQEMAHFADCVLNDREPIESGSDGRAALEVIYAAYRSAAAGRRITFPLELTAEEAAEPPFRVWRKAID
jgi:predicted dehydrogenase